MIFTPTDVADVSALILTAIKDNWSGVINIASPSSTSIVEISNKIGNKLKISPIFKYNKLKSAPVILPNLTRMQRLCPNYIFKNLEQDLWKFS